MFGSVPAAWEWRSGALAASCSLRCSTELLFGYLRPCSASVMGNKHQTSASIATTDCTHLRCHPRAWKLKLRYSARESVDPQASRPDFRPENSLRGWYLVRQSNQCHRPYQLGSFSTMLTFWIPAALRTGVSDLMGGAPRGCRFVLRFPMLL